MYNIIHLASSRGMRDSATPRRRVPAVVPEPAGGLAALDGDRARAAHEPVPPARPDRSPRPPSPSPSSG